MARRELLRQDAQATAKTMADAVNSALADIYQRLESLERRRLVVLDFSTASVLADTFPLQLPRLGFSVYGLVLVSARNMDDNSACPDAGAPSWTYRSDGTLQLDWLQLAAGKRHRITLEAIGG